MVTSRQEYMIALGSNLPSEAGDSRMTLQAALERLKAAGFEIRSVSRFFRTPCFPAGSGPDYVNAAAIVRFDGPPAECLARLHRVEAALGRERVQRWGQRTLDLDLLAADDLVLPDRATHDRWRTLPQARQIETAPDRLVLPHPRLQDRAFVLVPLADIAPDWVHPVLQVSVAAMISDLPEDDIAQVVAL